MLKMVPIKHLQSSNAGKPNAHKKMGAAAAGGTSINLTTTEKSWSPILQSLNINDSFEAKL
jgi:hypothetical protein